jgi:hypothetical protein
MCFDAAIDGGDLFVVSRSRRRGYKAEGCPFVKAQSLLSLYYSQYDGS